MNDKAQTYLKNRVLSASPEDLRLMLLEGAVKYARMGRTGLAERNYEKSYEGIHRCQDILIELVNSLRPEHNPELCDRLSGLYMYLYRRLMDASLERNASHCDEVIQLLEYEVETWTLLMAKLMTERTGATAEETTTVEGAPPPAESPAMQCASEPGTTLTGLKGAVRNPKLAALASTLQPTPNRPSISIQG